jgi:hypothetical protein
MAKVAAVEEYVKDLGDWISYLKIYESDSA